MLTHGARPSVTHHHRGWPDRIIVGKVRGGEALDELQAMNRGHEGRSPRPHANSARHLLWRLETMAMMSDIHLVTTLQGRV
jgi:pilus assembly protein CpaF